MATEMTTEQWRAFVSEGTRTAALATVRPDGRPHVAPIWFVLDEGTVVFNTGASTVKGKAVLRGTPVALSVDDPVPPFSFVTIEGTPEVSTDLEEMFMWASRIGGRYMGDDRAEEFGRRNAVEGELLVRVRPTRVIALRDIAD